LGKPATSLATSPISKPTAVVSSQTSKVVPPVSKPISSVASTSKPIVVATSPIKVTSTKLNSKFSGFEGGNTKFEVGSKLNDLF
jgi:hypothetical protein